MSASDSFESSSPSESIEARRVRNVQKPSIKTATSLLFSALKKTKQSKEELTKKSLSSQNILVIDETSSSSSSRSIRIVPEESPLATTATCSTGSTTSLSINREKHLINTTYYDAVSSNEDHVNSVCVQQDKLASAKNRIKSKKEAKPKVAKSKKSTKQIESSQYSPISSYESCLPTPNYSVEQQNELSFVSSDDAFYSSVKNVDSNNNLLMETTIQSEENARKSSTSTVRSVCKLTDEKLKSKPIVLVEKLSDAEFKSALEREEKRKKTRVRTKKNLGDDFYTYGLLSSDESIDSVQSSRQKITRKMSSSTVNSIASSIEHSNISANNSRGRSKSTKRRLINDLAIDTSEIKISAKMKKYATETANCSQEGETVCERKMSESDSVYSIRMQENGKIRISRSSANSDKEKNSDGLVSLNEESTSSSSSVRIIKKDKTRKMTESPNELIVISSASTSTLANVDMDANKNESSNNSSSNQFTEIMSANGQIEYENQQEHAETKESPKSCVENEQRDTSLSKSKLLFTSSDQINMEPLKTELLIAQNQTENVDLSGKSEKSQLSELEATKRIQKKKGKTFKKTAVKKSDETKIEKVATKSKVTKNKALLEAKTKNITEQKKLIAAASTTIGLIDSNKSKPQGEEANESANEKKTKTSSISTYKIPRLKLIEPNTSDQETIRTPTEKETEKEKKDSAKTHQDSTAQKSNEPLNIVKSSATKKKTSTLLANQQQQETKLTVEPAKETKTKELVEKRKKAVRKQPDGDLKVKSNSLLMNTFNFITRNSLKNSNAVGQNVSNFQLDIFSSSSNMAQPLERSSKSTNTRLRQPLPEHKTRHDLLTLGQIMDKKRKFNESLGVSYPYFSFLFLFDEYVKKMSAIQSLDFNLLLENVHQSEEQDVSAELSVNRLDHKEKVELCKLMSRSAGKFNIYKAVGFGNDLRNPSLNLNQNVQIRDDFGSESDEIEYVLSLISSLTLAKAYAAYSYFKSRLNSSFRIIQVYWDDVRNYDAVKVTFENDMLIESEDASLDQCIGFVLHKRSTQEIEIRRSLHSFYAQKLNSSSSIFDMNERTEEDQAYFLEEAKSRINDESLWDSMFINNFITNLKKIPLISLEELRRVKNYTLKNCLKRKANPDFEKFEHPDDKPRFVNKERSNVSWRGHMQKAIKHKLLNENEYQYRLSKLINQPDFNLDINNLFQKS